MSSYFFVHACKLTLKHHRIRNQKPLELSAESAGIPAVGKHGNYRTDP